MKDAGGQLKLSEDEKELIEKLELHGLGNEAQPFLHSVVTLIGKNLQKNSVCLHVNLFVVSLLVAVSMATCVCLYLLFHIASFLVFLIEGRLLQMATSKSADRTENRLAALAAFQLLTVTVQWREGFYHYSQQTGQCIRLVVTCSRLTVRLSPDHLVFRLYRSYLKVKDWTIDEAIRQLVSIYYNKLHYQSK